MVETLHCLECGSTNVEVCQDVEYDEQAEVECKDCGNIEVMTRRDPSDYFRE